MKLVAFGLALTVALGGGLAAGAALGPFEDGESVETPEAEADHSAGSGHDASGIPPLDADEGDEHAD